MLPKPKHLTLENAVRFKQQGVVGAYHLRLPYPPETFDILLSLMMTMPRTLLDVGTGTGEIAREMAQRVDRVDAVDISEPMLEKGKRAPHGDHPHLRWLHGAAETIELDPPYALITAADSLHWMEWEALFQRFHEVLAPEGFVAMLERSELPTPWENDLKAIIRRYSLVQNYEPFDLIDELSKRGIYAPAGEVKTRAVIYRQSIEDYVNSFHSRTSLSIQDMSPENAAEFDQLLREIVVPYADNDYLNLQTTAQIWWGKPLRK